MSNSKTISDSNALLLYRVGPVLCCSPTLSVESVVVPPSMKKPPGVDDLRPGIFKHVSGIVNIVDLRVAFGVIKNHQSNTGRIIIVKLEAGSPGFWVDEIIDVIEFPDKGWGQLPPLIPRDVFERTLLLNEKIQLYCDFDKLNACKKIGYLREYIERLDEEAGEKNNAILATNESDIDGQQESIAAVTVVEPEPNEKSKDGADIEIPVREQGASNSDEASDVKLTPSTDLEVTGQLPVQKKPPQNKEKDVFSSGHDAKSGLENKLTSGDRAVSSYDQMDDFEKEVSGYKKDISQENVVERQQSRYQEIIHPGSKLDDEDDNTWQFSVVVIGMALLLAIAVYYLLDGDLPNTDFSVDSRVVVMDDLSLTGIEKSVKIENESTFEHESVVEMADEPAKEDFLDSKAFEVETDLSKNEAVLSERDTMLDEGAISIEKDDQGYVIVVDNTEMIELNKVVSQEESVVTVGKEILSPSDLPSDGLNEIPATKLFKEQSAQAPVLEQDVELVIIPKNVAQREQSDKSDLDKEAINNNIHRYQVVHIVVKGDTLWHIAKRYIHNPYRYPELARLSNIKNPDLIYPGDRVKIIIIERQ